MMIDNIYVKSKAIQLDVVLAPPALAGRPPSLLAGAGRLCAPRHEAAVRAGGRGFSDAVETAGAWAVHGAVLGYQEVLAQPATQLSIR